MAVASAEVLAVASAEEPTARIEEIADTTGRWNRVVQAGFGDSEVGLFDPLVKFQGMLFAGGFDENKGCQLLRSLDGTTWERVIGPGTATPSGFGNPHNESINALVVFDDHLYAGTWNEIDGAELWRSPDGMTWTLVIGHGVPMAGGFGKQENSGITALAVFRDQLFAGTGSLYCKDGVEVWSLHAKSQTWEPIAGERFALQTAFARESKYLLDAEVFNGWLYFATGDQRTGGSEIWRTQEGRFWEATVGSPSAYRAGMGHVSHDMIFDLASFKGYLYAAVWDRASEGGALWRSPDGTTWEVVVGDLPARYPMGFGLSGNVGLVSLAVLGDQLFLGTTNIDHGAQLWASHDGIIWQCLVGPEAPVRSGFGDIENSSIFSLLAFRGQLYAGTRNDKGGEIWKLSAGFTATD